MRLTFAQNQFSIIDRQSVSFVECMFKQREHEILKTEPESIWNRSTNHKIIIWHCVIEISAIDNFSGTATMCYWMQCYHRQCISFRIIYVFYAHSEESIKLTIFVIVNTNGYNTDTKSSLGEVNRNCWNEC